LQLKAGMSPGLTGNQQEILSVRNETVKWAGVVKKIKTPPLAISIPLRIQTAVFFHVVLTRNCMVLYHHHQQYARRQVHSLFQNDSSSYCDLELPPSVPKVIQQLLTSSSSSSCHFYPPLYLSFNNFF
jgi:hypothetical protein